MSAKIAQKIIEVMKKCGYLQKDGNVSFKSTKYNFLSEEKVTSEISKARIEVGLAIVPIKAEQEIIDGKTYVKVTYLFIDSDSGETLEAQMIGQGADSQDKGATKALTQAFKYMQRQTFGIATGDDPDKISSDELDALEQERIKKEREEIERKRLKLQEDSKKLYTKLKGDLVGFDDFYNKLISEGKGDQSIHDFLEVKLSERLAKQPTEGND